MNFEFNKYNNKVISLEIYWNKFLKLSISEQQIMK